MQLQISTMGGGRAANFRRKPTKKKNRRWFWSLKKNTQVYGGGVALPSLTLY